nr:hypothetical protein [Streptomyces canus]
MALTTAFTSRARDEWTERFAATDACATPVLAYDEASHTRPPRLAQREAFTRSPESPNRRPRPGSRAPAHPGPPAR